MFLVAPNLHLSGLTILAKLVSVAYPLGDILLLAALIRFAVQAGAKGPAFYLLVGEHRRAPRDGLRLQLCAPRGHVQPPADLRRRLARLPRALGRGCAASVDARARGAGIGHPGAADPTRLALLALACLIAPGIHFVEELGNIDLLVVIGASADPLPARRRCAWPASSARRSARRRASSRCGRPALALVEAVGRASVNDEVAASAARDRRAVGQGPARPLDDPRARGSPPRTAPAPGTSRRRLPIGSGAQLGLREHVAVVAPLQSRLLVALGAGRGAETLVVRLSARDEDQGAIVDRSHRRTSRRTSSIRSRRSPRRSRSRSTPRRSPRTSTAQKSEARFRSLVAHSSDLITVLDQDGVVTYQSPSIERVLGYSVEEIEDQRFDRLLAEADRSRLRSR